VTYPDAPQPYDLTQHPGPAPKARKTGKRVLAIVAIVVGVVAANEGVRIWASNTYDTEAASLEQTRAEAVRTQNRLVTEVNRLEQVAEHSQAMLAIETLHLTPEDARDTLVNELSKADSLLSTAKPMTTTVYPGPASKPGWSWELFSAATALRQEASGLHTTVATTSQTASEVAATTRNTEQLLSTQFLPETIAAISEFEQKYVSALNAKIIKLRASGELLGILVEEPVSEATVIAFRELNEQASAVAESHRAVLAKKKGALYNRRLTVEAWARNIAGGVMLDFEWRQIVNGYGNGGSAGGLATWNAAHGGYATIILSNSVASLWPDQRMKALVAHEVGHAISAKCYDLFNWESRDANEEWATAWAISKGHTADGNGVSLYGYPRQSIINKAKTCR
jgi:hypothetical protein